jgi:hypothetical protein
MTGDGHHRERMSRGVQRRLYHWTEAATRLGRSAADQKNIVDPAGPALRRADVRSSPRSAGRPGGPLGPHPRLCARRPTRPGSPDWDAAKPAGRAATLPRRFLRFLLGQKRRSSNQSFSVIPRQFVASMRFGRSWHEDPTYCYARLLDASPSHSFRSTSRPRISTGNVKSHESVATIDPKRLEQGEKQWRN